MTSEDRQEQLTYQGLLSERAQLQRENKVLTYDVGAARRELATQRRVARENRAKWSFDTLVFVAHQLLDEHYPADLFGNRDGDVGVRFIVELRAALDEIERTRP